MYSLAIFFNPLDDSFTTGISVASQLWKRRKTWATRRRWTAPVALVGLVLGTVLSRHEATLKHGWDGMFCRCQMSFLGVYGRSMRYMYIGISNNILLYYTITNVNGSMIVWLVAGGRSSPFLVFMSSACRPWDIKSHRVVEHTLSNTLHSVFGKLRMPSSLTRSPNCLPLEIVGLHWEVPAALDLSLRAFLKLCTLPNIQCSL